MMFTQTPPTLGNQYADDRVLRSYLSRVLPAEVLAEVEPSLEEMGRLAGGELYQLQLADRLNEPQLTQWDAWGERVDRIEVSPLWQAAERIAAEHGVVAAAYEQTYGALSRVYQFALAYLFGPSTDVYSCPLAMTDGAARTLLYSGNQALIDRALPHLTSRNPDQFWTSGQWMTELTGGSDVGTSETIARHEKDDVWRLYGRKWFASATTTPIALTLARPEGNGPGGRGLALFYVELRDEAGRLRNIRVDRLKDKLGTRKVPTAELTLDGTPARLVMGTTNGVRNITPMLNITRTWNSIIAASLMRRGLALARNYARKRVAFGAPLSEKPLHLDTLAGLQAETEAAFHLAFRLVELIGFLETDGLDAEEEHLLRLLTAVTKLTTARQAVAVVSEAIEAFGGAGYVEDTGLPTLLRDAHVLSIWEGTTNVLSLESLRALAKAGGLAGFKAEIARILDAVREDSLLDAARTVQEAVNHAEMWLAEAMEKGQEMVEAGARRFAMTLGRSLALALLIGHAQWSLHNERDGRAAAAARRFARNGVDLIASPSLEESAALANDTPLPVVEPVAEMLMPA